MIGELRVFTKSMRAVRVLAMAGSGEWQVERISGSSTGKIMICSEQSLSTIDFWLDDLPGQNGTASHASEALELIQSLGWPVWIDDNASHQVGEYSHAVAVLGSSYWLAAYNSLESASQFCKLNNLTINF